jgi:glycosyltransferase involved in cell wall biosynthesis
MKILHISTSDLAHGAGIAAYNLHLSLNKLGHSSKMLVSEKLSDNPYVYSAKSAPQNIGEKLVRRGKAYLERNLNKLGPQNIYSSISSDLSNHPLVQEADIINIHNLHWHERNFSIFVLKTISQVKPIVWTFHDMWPVTGHCIYSLDCNRWQTGCGKCPDLNMTIPLKLDTTASLFKIKKSLYSQSGFTVVTPSQWLKEIASSSPLLANHKIVRVANGLNKELYQPLTKQQARQALGIDNNCQVVLFGAAHWSAPFKGYSYFEQAILNLKNSKPNLLLLGFGTGDFSEKLKSQFATLALGYIDHVRFKAIIYAAADIFVFPTMAEAFGNVAIESMFCGTPIVGFDTGGVADTIVHMQTGYIAKKGSVEDLAKGILTLLDDHQLRENMSKKGIERVANNFTSEIQAKGYLEVYQEETERFLCKRSSIEYPPKLSTQTNNQ